MNDEYFDATRTPEERWNGSGRSRCVLIWKRLKMKIVKRETAAQREAREIAAIRTRIKDIAQGAYGYYSDLGYDGEFFGSMAAEMGLDAFARWLGGIKNALCQEVRDGYAGIQEATDTKYLEKFDTLDTAAAHLYSLGVRVGGAR